MSVGTPDNSTQVEDRIKADVQREAPDSNPYLTVHWLRSLIAGIARRIFDFYQDLTRTEKRLLPDTADAETAPIWGNIFVGPENPASSASGQLVATGTLASGIGIGVSLVAGSTEYLTVSSGTIADVTLNVLTITRSGTTATVTTASDHNLSSFVPVTLSGADQTEYNITDATITVTGLDAFTYQVTGSPTTPATGVILSDFTIANVNVDAVDFGAAGNQVLDTPLVLGSPIVGIDNTMHVTFGALGGGADQESLADYKTRYLDKIRNPVAHFNDSDIIAKAKEVTGVTRVFVEEAGTVIGSIALSSLTRNANVATATSTAPHGYDDGQLVAVSGADQADYNVTDKRIIVEDPNVFHYIVFGLPTTPATGTILAAATIPLGQLRIFFMRDNDVDPIPSASEVADVQSIINTIRPANTSEVDSIVKAPTAVPVNYVFTNLTPNTATMRAAVNANLDQFHAEDTSVGIDVDEDAYRCAIKGTVDPDTGDTVETFTLSAPSGDITVGSGGIATKGTVSF